MIQNLHRSVSDLAIATDRMNARANDLDYALHCLMFALGKQPGIDVEAFREHFLEVAALCWTRSSEPRLLSTMLRQLDAGARKRDGAAG